MNKAIIVGCQGQDGLLTFDYLIEKGYSVIGVDRNYIRYNKEKKNQIDILKKDEVFDLVANFQPKEIYYLAAYHNSSQDIRIENLELIENSYSVNVFGLLHFLEAIYKYSPQTRLFYAASSLIFGEAIEEKQNEKNPFTPDSIYGISKLDGLNFCRFYRNNYNVFASVGIFYNHESPYRQDKFITKKIVKTAVKIKRKLQNELIIGDLTSEVDWGYAPDYVDAAYRILNIDNSDDFIIATGEKHTVQEFVTITFDYLGMDWKKYVKEDKSLLTRTRKTLVGNSEKLFLKTGWKPTVDFKEMIRILVIAEGETINEAK